MSGNVELSTNVNQYLKRHRIIFGEVCNLRRSYKRRLKEIRENIFVIECFFVKIRGVIKLLVDE